MTKSECPSWRLVFLRIAAKIQWSSCLDELVNQGQSHCVSWHRLCKRDHSSDAVRSSRSKSCDLTLSSSTTSAGIAVVTGHLLIHSSLVLSHSSFLFFSDRFIQIQNAARYHRPRGQFTGVEICTNRGFSHMHQFRGALLVSPIKGHLLLCQ